MVTLPALAAALADYGRRGAVALTAGARAEAVVAAARRHGGVLTAADLAGYVPIWREPVRFERLGWSFVTMPLPSSGGILLGEALALLELGGWADAPRGGADRAHLFAEAFRRAFADRFLLGDPASARARRRAARPGLARHGAPRARPAARHAIGGGAAPTWRRLLSRRRASRRRRPTRRWSTPQEPSLALTTTLNELFGCGLFVPELGQFLNNEMDDFTTAPGVPNAFGIVQGEANLVAPGRRMLSSMSPTLALRGGEVVVLGGRGGSRIPTAAAQVLLALLADGDELQAAVDRPRLHHQWPFDRLEAEADALASERPAPSSSAAATRSPPPTPPPRSTPSAATPTAPFSAAADRRGPAVPASSAGAERVGIAPASASRRRRIDASRDPGSRRAAVVEGDPMRPCRPFPRSSALLLPALALDLLRLRSRPHRRPRRCWCASSSAGGACRRQRPRRLPAGLLGSG